jgi:hypothetical protein
MYFLKNWLRETILLMFIFIVNEYNFLTHHFNSKMNFKRQVHYGAFKSTLKFVSCYEMVWKLAFMIHQHVIEFWVEDKKNCWRFLI